MRAVRNDEAKPGGILGLSVGGLAIAFVGLMVLFAIAGGATAPKPERIDQESWLIFTDRPAYGLDETVINGVWRNVMPAGRETPLPRQCGLRSYGVKPGRGETFIADIEDDNRFGDGRQLIHRVISALNGHTKAFHVKKLAALTQGFTGEDLETRLGAVIGKSLILFFFYLGEQTAKTRIGLFRLNTGLRQAAQQV